MGGLVGRTLGRYEIMAFVGRGGMGEVFRARDTELGREVAVKVLPAETAGDDRRLERFRREVRAVARLSHPNILDIHDFGTEDGVSFSVSELLEGNDLRERLEGHLLPVSKVVSIGRAVAEGLAAAHGKGIVHRDIKPANIFITKNGQVKILDFGIARLRHDPADGPVETSDATLTEAGHLVGTTAYMSPEQIAAKPADARSDIFSLGCVLYEMLTGTKAFSGRNLRETMVAVVSQDPTPVTEIRPEVPPALDLLIRRCLEKEPGERFESARDVAFALQATAQQTMVDPTDRGATGRRLPRWLAWSAAMAVVAILFTVAGVRLAGRLPTGPTVLPRQRHLAIMPLQTGGESPEVARYAAGLRAILVDDLDRLFQRQPYGWWVVPLDMVGAAPTMEMSTVHRSSNPNVVLLGFLARGTSSLRLDLETVDPVTGRVFRSVGVDADFGNVSSLQIDPVLRAAEVVGLELTQDERELFRARATSVARVYDLYVGARGLLAGSPSVDDLIAAVAMLDEAVALDPLFRPAREQLAQAQTAVFDATGDRELFDRAMVELRVLDADQPSERSARIAAALLRSAGDSTAAVDALGRAVAAAPRSGAAFLELGFALQREGRVTDAESAFQRSIYLRPGYWHGPDSLGRLHLGEGRYDAAANCFRRVIDWAPSNKIGYNLLGAIQFFQDDLEASLEVFSRSIEVDPEDNYFAYANLGKIHFEAARFADAIAAYDQALAISDQDYMVWGNLAYAYAFGAEPEKAKAHFDHAIELAETRVEAEPENLQVLTDLAGFFAMVDEPAGSREMLERVIALQPRDPQIFADIGETFEDLGDREAALEWIGRALTGGVHPRVFDSQPMLRELVADPRYRELVERSRTAPN